MKFSRQLPSHTRRDAWLEINLQAIEHNVSVFRKIIGANTQLMAIVKADAYGHGAVMVIPTLEACGVSMVGVAAMDEALQIRKAGLTIPILVIGVIPDWAIKYAVDNDIQLTLFQEQHLESLEKIYQQTQIPIKVHIKVDTGMHRIGVAWEEAPGFIKHCQQQPFLKVEGIFTHFACAEDTKVSQLQLQRWETVLSQVNPLPPYLHIANSLGTLNFTQSHYNLVRCGIGLYGYSGDKNTMANLKPVLGLKARIIHLQQVPTNTGISYGHRHHTKGDTIIATLPLGYADGVPRILSGKIEGLLRGVRIPQIGTITMDQLMFDVSAVPDAHIGEAITLLGEEQGQQITLSDWATQANTIEYELMCGLRVRLPKTYTRH